MRLLDSEVTTCHPWPLVKSQSHHLLPPWAVTGRGTARAPSALWDGKFTMAMCPYFFPIGHGLLAPRLWNFSPARITSHNAKQNWADRKTTTCSDMSKISMKSSHMDDLSRCKDANCRTGNGMICADVLFTSYGSFQSPVAKAFFFQTRALGSRAGVKCLLVGFYYPLLPSTIFLLGLSLSRCSRGKSVKWSNSFNFFRSKSSSTGLSPENTKRDCQGWARPLEDHCRR